MAKIPQKFYNIILLFNNDFLKINRSSQYFIFYTTKFNKKNENENCSIYLYKFEFTYILFAILAWLNF